MEKFKKGSLLVGILVSVAILGAIAAISYTLSPKKDTPIVYAKSDALQELWSASKQTTIEKGTNRTLDKQQNNISTSEGQSYTLLRAVWMDDQQQYDASLQWTKDNLQRDDHLFSWKFGKLPNGKYGIQDTVGGQNTATDGDSDIALSLLMAYSRWREDKYLYDAKAIISSMWEREVVVIDGRPVLVANDLERNDPTQVIVNPSYFSPYSYKLFAKVDPSHDWSGLADNSYKVLLALSDANLDVSKSSGLPPDWVVMNRSTGAFSKAPDAQQTTNFGYDAMRIPFRMALDYAWYKDPRDKQVLAKYSALHDTWQNDEKLAAIYTHDGKRATEYEAGPAIYGGTIGYFMAEHPKEAKQIYDRKLVTLYNPDTQRWKTPLSYYDDNWSWFGIALYQNQLPNLAEQT